MRKMNKMNEIHEELNEFPVLQKMKQNSINNFNEIDASFLESLKKIPNSSKPKTLFKVWAYSAAAAAVLIFGTSVFYLTHQKSDDSEMTLIESELIFDEITLIQEFVYAE